MTHLGKEGYKKIMDRCMKMTHRLVDEVQEFGIFPLIDPVMNIVALGVTDLDEVRKQLRSRGWFTSITRSPRAMRLVIMPHLTDEALTLFISDLKDCTRD